MDLHVLDNENGEGLEIEEQEYNEATFSASPCNAPDTDELSDVDVQALGIVPDEALLIAGIHDDLEQLMSSSNALWPVQISNNSRTGQRPVTRQQVDFFGRFGAYPELLMEVTRHLRPADAVSLYSISKDFHETLNGHLSHILKATARYQALESSRVFVFNLYGSLCIPDPVGRTRSHTQEVRKVPSLRWLQMVVHRERAVRDILACMAREGHRMPKTMSLTLKKMWLTMDIATSNRRVQLMHNEQFWTDNDIYNVQLFMIKLDMRFNDPIDGPADDGLRRLMLGQKGLTPLRKLLKRQAFLSTIEIVQAGLRYCYPVGPAHAGLPICGIPSWEIGKGHLEGWGRGRVHLYRMDELIPREAARRNLGLDVHMMSMLMWGYVDPVTKENIKVSAEEMYMSDED